MPTLLSILPLSILHYLAELHFEFANLVVRNNFMLLSINYQADQQDLLDLQAEQIEKLKMWIVAFLIVAFIIIVVMSLIMQSNRLLRRQNATIKSQQDEISRINEYLAIQVENLRELDNEKNSVISYVSHDLLTPLGNIEGLVNVVLLEKENLTQDQKEYLEKMLSVVTNGRELIHSMLNISKIEQEMKGIDLMEHNAVQLIEEAILGHQFLIDEKKVNIIKEHSQPALKFKTDKQYFKQIIGNLLSYAVHSTPENKEVVISSAAVNETVQIKIKDQGPGLSEKDKDRIFLKYVQNRGGANHQGIAMAIVKQLVEKLNAKIRVESTPDDGTQFILEFLIR